MLGLVGLEPEGGFFKRTYPPPYQSPIASAIYYLLKDDDISAMHCLNADEIYHFYDGDPLEILCLYPDGTGAKHLLGRDLKQGMRPQILIPAHCWQGSIRLQQANSQGFSLIGTTMTPAFTWEGFELGNSETLIQTYPEWAEDITRRLKTI
ncbi:MAG: cupin domain-containing protein [Deinococcales bacterium]